MTTEAELLRRIDRIKAALSDLGDLRPGSLSVQYNVCRTPGCRCKADPPERHGPYHQLSYTHGGRSRTENVANKDLPAMRAQLHNYKKLRQLVSDWVDAGIELDRIRRARSR
jgi:hypothetical protein